jgi:hypothetical protein
MNTARKLIGAIVVTCGPLAFLMLETAPKIWYFGAIG